MGQDLYSIGYLPDFKHARENIFLLLEFFENNSNLDQSELLEKMIEEKICNSMSSARLTLTTLRNYGLIKMNPHDIGKYELSPEAKDWMGNPTEVDLFKIIDPSVRFLSEILYELQEGAKDYMELRSIAQTKYLTRVPASNFTRTTQLLKSLGFVQSERSQKTSFYGITPKGIELINELGKDYLDKKMKGLASIRTIPIVPRDKYSILIEQVIKGLNELKESGYIEDGFVSVKEICIYILPISGERINRIYRNKPLLLEADIKKVLEFLSCSLIEAVECKDDRYSAKKTLNQFKNEIEKIFKYYIKWGWNHGRKSEKDI